MENLNKENLFNELFEKHPKGTKHFCDWVDGYKKRVGWNALFGDSFGNPAPKFHDLPFDFQVGIILRFILENEHLVKETSNKEDYEPIAAREAISDFIGKLDLVLNN